MKARKILNKNKKNYLMDLTPLIDVVFLLLIFFMVATNFSNLSGLDIKLPRTKNIQVENPIKNVRILVDSQRNLLIQYEEENKNTEERITKEQLFTTLSKIIEKSQYKNISLVAHKDLDYGYVVSLMEEIKRAGAQGLNIETEGER